MNLLRLCYETYLKHVENKREIMKFEHPPVIKNCGVFNESRARFFCMNKNNSVMKNQVLSVKVLVAKMFRGFAHIFIEQSVIAFKIIKLMSFPI
jgi:hypothetical protein